MRIAPLLLAGLAAFGYYKYTQMTEEEKNDLKEKGKKFVDDHLGGLKDILGKAETQTAGGDQNTHNGFSQA